MLSWLNFSFAFGLLDLEKQFSVNEQVLFVPRCWKSTENGDTFTVSLETKAVWMVMVLGEWGPHNGRGL